MSVFSNDAHSILRQPALICANGIGLPAFLNSEHSMVLYLRLYLYFRFFPIAGTPGTIPWPNERSVEVLKERLRSTLSNRCSQMPACPAPHVGALPQALTMTAFLLSSSSLIRRAIGLRISPP